MIPRGIWIILQVPYSVLMELVLWFHGMRWRSICTWKAQRSRNGMMYMMIQKRESEMVPEVQQQDKAEVLTVRFLGLEINPVENTLPCTAAMRKKKS